MILLGASQSTYYKTLLFAAFLCRQRKRDGYREPTWAQAAARLKNRLKTVQAREGKVTTVLKACSRSPEVSLGTRKMGNQTPCFVGARPGRGKCTGLVE